MSKFWMKPASWAELFRSLMRHATANPPSATPRSYVKCFSTFKKTKKSSCVMKLQLFSPAGNPFDTSKGRRFASLAISTQPHKISLPAGNEFVASPHFATIDPRTDGFSFVKDQSHGGRQNNSRGR